MRIVTIRLVLLAGLLLAGPGASRADGAIEAYAAIGIKPQEVLSGTCLTSRMVPGETKQLVCTTTYMTGKRTDADAVNVRLDVFDQDGESLRSLYTRDFGAENGGFVADGNLQLVDLDRDGLAEIVVSFKSYLDPLIAQQPAEVIIHDGDGFRTAWSGPLSYDATKAARSVPPERRDRFSREIDLNKTMSTRGLTLFFNKRFIAVAGERLARPRVVQEAFPLRAPSTHPSGARSGQAPSTRPSTVPSGLAQD